MSSETKRYNVFIALNENKILAASWNLCIDTRLKSYTGVDRHTHRVKSSFQDSNLELSAFGAQHIAQFVVAARVARNASSFSASAGCGTWCSWKAVTRTRS
jgi:hypothetical protein